MNAIRILYATSKTNGSQRMSSIADVHLHVCYTTCINCYLCPIDSVNKIVSVTINRRIEHKKNKIISKVEMMSLQVISVLASSSAVFVVLSETTFFRGKHRRSQWCWIYTIWFWFFKVFTFTCFTSRIIMGRGGK
jgi:hypothetical protein